MRLGGAMRGIRATVFAGVCVVLALVGHVHMSGAPVPTTVALGAFTAVAVLAWLCAGARRGATRVTVAAVGVQGLLHAAFSGGQLAGGASGGTDSASSGAAGPAPASVRSLANALLCGDLAGPPLTDEEALALVGAAGLNVPGHDHAATAAHHGAAHAAHTAHGAEHLHSLGMLAAHLGAALLSGLWLAWGERATCSLLELLALWLAAPLRLATAWTPPAPAPRFPNLRPRRAPDPRTRLLLHTVVSRGPPALRAVA